MCMKINEAKGQCDALNLKLPTNYNNLNQRQRRVVREWYAEQQEGNCLYCGGDLNVRPTKDKAINLKLFPPNFLKWPVHLQHDHHTLMTEGAVHAYCNAVLWQYHGK